MLRERGDIQDPVRPGIHNAGVTGGGGRHVGQEGKPGSRRVLHTYSEVAEMCGVSLRTVQRLVADGTLPRHEVLNRIPGTAVRRFLQRLQYESKKIPHSDP